MVRLVFRPYTQVRKAICTSAHLRASTRVSSGFALLRHSSPSFGSQHTDSDAILSQKLMVGRGCGPQQPSPPSISLRLMGLPPTGSHACCTPWSVFQDGHIESLLPASEGRSSRRTEAPRCLDRPDGVTSPSKTRFLPPEQSMPARRPKIPKPSRARRVRAASVTSNAFPLNNFKHFLTLFSKFFSSFPRGTCSLSVSRRYLALDGIYHPLFAAFPNNKTLRRRFVQRGGRRRRGSHPLGHSLPGDLGADSRRSRLDRPQFSGASTKDSQVGLFPVRSPLLGESWLVSSPPLIDMLKFSGCSCLNSGQNLGVLLRLEGSLGFGHRSDGPAGSYLSMPCVSPRALLHFDRSHPGELERPDPLPILSTKGPKGKD